MSAIPPSYAGRELSRPRLRDLPAAAFATKCRAQLVRDVGAIMSPQNAFLSWLGCDTLALRMERHSSNAQAVAAYLAKHPRSIGCCTRLCPITAIMPSR